MSGALITVREYLLLIEISDDHRLLVEGPDDKTAFRCLLDEARRTGHVGPARLVIDTAEMFTRAGAGASGNRALVEAVAQDAGDRKSKNKVVCFVDREFREFSDARWEDGLKGHRVSDRLVWSRGHSVENYYLDFETIRRALRAVGATDGFEEAISLFADVFSSVLQVACAVGLAGRDTGNFTIIRGSIDETIFDMTGTAAVIDQVRWKRQMLRKTRCGESTAQGVIDAYDRWHSELIAVNPDVIRWMSHGEITLMTLWAGYARCLRQIRGGPGTSPRPYRASVDVRANVCAHTWAQRALADDVIFPRIVLEMLGFQQASPVGETATTPSH